MLPYSEYESYFETLATRFKLIGHTPEKPKFAALDIEHILSNQKGKLDINSPVFILESPEGKFAWQNDTFMDTKFGAFMILQYAKPNNPEARRQVLDNTQEIGMKVIARMQYERLILNKGVKDLYPHFILFFNLDDTKYQKVGPVFNDCYGWRFEFDLSEQSKLPFDSDEWTDFDELP